MTSLPTAPTNPDHSICQWIQIRIHYGSESRFGKSNTASNIDIDISRWDWMRRPTSRLQLNATKAQVMWSGSSQQLKPFNDIPVLTTQLKVAESARDLGVTLDSPLSLSYQVATLCQSGFYQLRQLRSDCTITYSWRCQDVDPSIRLMPSGLLQLTVVWCIWQPHQEAAVSPEHCCTSGLLVPDDVIISHQFCSS